MSARIGSANKFPKATSTSFEKPTANLDKSWNLRNSSRTQNPWNSSPICVVCTAVRLHKGLGPEHWLGV